MLKERKEGSSWSVEVVVITGLGRHFQLAGCQLLTARWDSVGCGEYVVQCMQFTDTVNTRPYPSRERGHLEPSPPTETFLTAASLNSQIPNFDPEQSFPSYLISRCS